MPFGRIASDKARELSVTVTEMTLYLVTHFTYNLKETFKKLNRKVNKVQKKINLTFHVETSCRNRRMYLHFQLSLFIDVIRLDMSASL